MEAQKAQAKYDKEHPPESDDDEGPRKRRKKKKKDPDAPKKPTSAYFFYQREVRQQVKDDAPEGTSVRDIAKLVAERWRKLTEDEKRVRVTCDNFYCPIACSYTCSHTR